VAKDLLDDLGEKFGWSFSQELLDEENFRLELLTINPEQGYSNLL
jgi:hypothetical protein